MSNSSLSSSPARSTAAVAGASVPSPATGEDVHFPTISSIHDRKDEALPILKSGVMNALNKEVKSMDDDNWMFEGPRSRINLISRPGGRLDQHTSFLKNDILAPPK